MFAQVLKQFFWDTYDHLGRLVLLNVLLFFICMPAAYFAGHFVIIFGQSLSVPMMLLLLAFAFVVLGSFLESFCISGLLHFGFLVSREKDPPARTFLAGLREAGARVFLFLFSWNLVAAILLLNVWFYFFSGVLTGALLLVGYAIGGICIWLLVMMIGLVVHALPLHVRRKRSLRELYKLSLGLLFKYPWPTFATIVFILSLIIIGVALKFIGILVYGFIAPVMLMNSLHDVIIDRLTEAENAATDAPARAASWKEIQAQESASEEERLRKARYQRTLRDLLRPWEM